MLIDLWNSMDGKSVFGLTCLAVLLYWLKRVEYPKTVLPPPNPRCIASRHERIWITGLLK